MKNQYHLSILLSIALIIGCNDKKPNSAGEAATVVDQTTKPLVDQAAKPLEDETQNLETPFYIQCIAAVPTMPDADKLVSDLKARGFKAGSLWIPDYKSLSGAKLYSVFIGPFETSSECQASINANKSEFPDSYEKLVSNELKNKQLAEDQNTKASGAPKTSSPWPEYKPKGLGRMMMEELAPEVAKAKASKTWDIATRSKGLENYQGYGKLYDLDGNLIAYYDDGKMSYQRNGSNEFAYLSGDKIYTKSKSVGSGPATFDRTLR